MIIHYSVPVIKSTLSLLSNKIFKQKYSNYMNIRKYLLLSNVMHDQTVKYNNHKRRLLTSTYVLGHKKRFWYRNNVILF